MRRKLLIVEDEAHIRSLLEQTLEELEDDYGVELFTARDGLEAMEIIEREEPDLVFLDIMMPKMNGYEVCQRIKENPRFEQTIVIILTAKGQKVDQRKGLDIGAHGYMTKPFDPDEVLELAMTLLGLHREQN